MSNVDNLPNALKVAIETTRPSLILYLHAAGETPEASVLRDLLVEVGLEDGRVVFLPVGDETAPDQQVLVGLIEQHQLRASLVVFSASLAFGHCAAWASIASTCLSEDGLMIGCHPISDQRDLAVQELGRAFGHNFSLGLSHWFLSPYCLVMRPLNSLVAGRTDIFKLFSFEEELEAVPDRGAFLQLSRAGIACLYPTQGGTPYRNEPGLMLQDGVMRPSDSILYYPEANESEGVTDPGFMAYARNLRMQGAHSLIYASHDSLYKDSYNPCAHRHFDLVPPWDPLIRTHDLGLGQPVYTTYFLREMRVQEPVVVVNWPDSYCYHHWIYYLLPKFWYLDELPELADLPIVMSPLLARFQREYLDLLGLTESKRFIFVDKSLTYRFERAYVPTIYERPYHTGAGVRWMRERLLPKAGAVPAGYEDGLYYVTRRNVTSRQILNEDEMIAYLEGLGFKSLDWAEHSVREQIALAKHAKAIIIPNGSGVTNLIFASPGLRYLNIAGRGHTELGDRAMVDWTIFTVNELGGQAYHAVADQSGFDSMTHSVAPMRMDMAVFKETVERMMA